MNLSSLILQLLSGLGNTLLLFVMTLVLSLPLGLLVTFGRMSKWSPLRFLRHPEKQQSRFLIWLSDLKPIQLIFKFLISILRGTPLMLQIIVVFFGPFYVFRIKLSASYRVIAVILAFSINYAAYLAEIFRSGIQGIPNGQREAARVLGYNRTQTFFKIILPQVIKRILPSITNEVITLVKDTSLSFTLSVAEMFTIAKALAASQTNMIPFVAAGIFYYVFNLIVAVVMEWIEKKLDYYR